jgi:uncharacterized protein YjiS (DUF1127 family)
MCRMSTEDARAVAAMARDPNEIWVRRRRALARGRALHGMAIGRVLRRAAGCLAWLIRAVVVAPLRHAFRQRTDTLLLLSMNDRMLADIGLMRADVQALAYGLVPVGHFDFAADPIEAAPPVGGDLVGSPCGRPDDLSDRLPQAA